MKQDAPVRPRPAPEPPRQASPLRRVVRIIGGAIVVVGTLLLGRVVYEAAAGVLAARVLGAPAAGTGTTLLATGLALPVPFHVIAIGLIIQKRWLPPRWQRVAWVAIVGSGCWLGLSLAVRALL